MENLEKQIVQLSFDVQSSQVVQQELWKEVKEMKELHYQQIKYFTLGNSNDMHEAFVS